MIFILRYDILKLFKLNKGNDGKMNNSIKIFLVILILLYIHLFYKTTYAITDRQVIEDGVYIIKSATDSNYALDVSWGSIENGANIQLYSVNNTDAQKFKVKYLENGYYEIESLKSGKVLDVANAGKTSGTNLWQYEKNNTDAQKWIIRINKDNTYSIISKINDLYIDIEFGKIKSQQNIQLYTGNGTNAQKFLFEKEKTNEEIFNIKAEKTIEDGMYIIRSNIDNNYVIDVKEGSKKNCANIQLYYSNDTNAQKFQIKYLNNGYYEIESVISGKMLDVENAGMISETNIWQYEKNGTDAQKWIIKKNEDNTYSIISKLNFLYVDVLEGTAINGQNIQVYNGNNSNAQKFIFEKTQNSYSININSSKYPGYKESLEKLKKQYSNWNFEFLYTGLNYDDVLSGECNVHSRNLVPKAYSGEWICLNCGTTIYDNGWYCASKKAIAYYMDPRNFLDEVNIFQFQDINQFNQEVCTLDGVRIQVKDTYLENYVYDIYIACKNKNVNTYYIISRLLQEQGKKGTVIGTGMYADDGKIYYNPFNIGANGNGYDIICANALSTAKKYGWDSMKKAIEGGIDFCKNNWLNRYQNTLYQNKFDIDIRKGTPIYTHQYMQNLMGSYSEGRLLNEMYYKTNNLNSNFTFIIPVYENMSVEKYESPKNTFSKSPINVQITTAVNLRENASTNSQILKTIYDKNTIIISVQRNINGNWHKVILIDGTIGYILGDYLQQIETLTNCNYSAIIKTNDGRGCYVRVGPSIKLDKIGTLSEGTKINVIDKDRYQKIDGYDWCRVKLNDGSQGFIPIKYLTNT